VFGGFCLLMFEAILVGGTPRLPVLTWVVMLEFFDASLFGVFWLGQIVLIRILPVFGWVVFVWRV
jgi:hypothetical protein